MLSSFRLGTALVAGLVIAGAVTAQNTPNNRRNLNNGGDVVFIYGDPTVGASAGSGAIDTSGDLYWMVWPRQAMIASSGSTEMSGASFGLFDTDWTDSAPTFDILFGPGVTNGTNGSIEPDFSATGLAASTLLLGGPTGFPNPCTASPGFCTSIGGTSICPPSGSVVGFFVNIQLISACDGTGILFTANNTVDNVVTAFLPGGMTFASGPGGQCNLGNYTLQTETSTNETQADNGPTSGSSRYGGFQVGAAPGLIMDGVAERSVYDVEFCDIMVNTTITGDRGTVGLHVDGTLGITLQQVVADTAGLSPTELAFVSNCVLPPFPAPGIPIFGAGVMLNLADPTVSATLKKGPIASVPDFAGSAYPFTQDQFTPAGLPVTIPASPALTLSSQAVTVNVLALTARGSLLTKTTLN
jgi:hypothetical protein